MDIHIVNLREELAGYYGRLGYAAQGTLPFSHPHRARRPCHFVVMTKTLTPSRALAPDDDPNPTQEDASDPPDGLSGVWGPGELFRYGVPRVRG